MGKPAWMKDALRRIGMMKQSKSDSAKGRTKSMPIINIPEMKKASEDAVNELPGILEEPTTQKSVKGHKRTSRCAVPLKSKAGLLSKMTRNSAPALSLPQKSKGDKHRAMSPTRSKSPKPEPIIGEMVPKNVNQLKAMPFSLSEKMSRWCKRSPMALIKSHMPPQDAEVPFPNPPYEDMMCDEYGRNIDTLARIARHGPLPPRDELVIQRYPAGRHGITCTFDNAPPEPTKAIKKPERPQAVDPAAAPGYDIGSNTRRLIRNTSDTFDEEPSRKISQAGDKPAPPRRVPTNISIIPQRTMSNLDDNMLADLAKNMFTTY